MVNKNNKKLIYNENLGKLMDNIGCVGRYFCKTIKTYLLKIFLKKIE